MTVYLMLLHGRHHPDEQLDDWGFSGPILGPFCAVHFTYMTHVRCLPLDPTGDELTLSFTDDLLTYDGKFYGDFEIAHSFPGAGEGEAAP